MGERIISPLNGRKPTRDFDALSITHNPPGAQKEKVKGRSAAVPLSVEYDHIPYVHEQWGGTYREEVPEEVPRRKAAAKTARPYAEMRAASAFSFLDSAALPEDLMAIAAQRDLPAMALVDTNGVYGAPRVYGTAKKTGVQARVGVELVLDSRGQSAEGRGQKGHHTDRLTVLVENRTGYKNLCRLLTAGALAHPKGEARYSWRLIEEHAAGLRCLTRADEARSAEH